MSTATSNTLELLSRLAAGRFQRIGDELLQLMDVRLSGLQSNGVNHDDRTVTGVPDSFVGPSPQDCLVAVEYTTQRSGIARKFARDLAEVAGRCPKAGLIVLVSASSIDGLDLTEVRAEARTHGRDVLPIGGEQLARLLDSERQDLRRDYLNIPIGTHSIDSVRRVFAAHTRTALTDGHVRREDLDVPIQRDRLTREVAVRTGQLGGRTYVHAPIGTGKSTWSCGFAMGRGETTPAVWIAATDVTWHAGIDPLAAHLTHIAYGAPSPERALDLADLLGRAGVGLVLVLDGIDEVEDYALLVRALKEFGTGAVGARTHLIATFRTNALYILGDSLPRRPPDSGDTIIAMPIPEERDMTSWLERCGTPSGHARQAMSILPRDLWRPLFLRLAVGLPRDALKSEAALVHRVVEHYSGELAAALRMHGVGPSAAEVRESIGALAWACMSDPADAVPRSAAFTNGDLWRADGERSLLGRAVACGLLRIRSRDRLAFTHAFFQEAFAAAVAPTSAVAWDERVDALRPESRRARIGALIDRLPDPEPLLDALLARDPVLALWCASRVTAGLSDPVTERLLPHVEQLLQSRFRSDRRAGLELLGRLRGPRARAFVANWVRSLNADRLKRSAPYLALALWEQRLPEPFGLLLQHPRLRLPDGMPWIEPAFVEEVAALPETFREAVRLRALRVANCDPDLGETARDSAQLLLALLGDQRLVQILRARIAREGRLGPSDHRLLIFLDTEESIALYADSAEAYLTEIRAISRNDDSEGSRRSNLMHDIVLKHSDIAMFPHDRLLEVVECALDTPDPLLAWFGLEWLHIVIAARLIPAVCRATYTLRGYLFVDPRLPDERLAGRTTVEALVDQFRRGDFDVQRFVVRQLAGHHEDAAIDFLCQLLNDPDLAGHAARSLGQLGSGRAVPFLVAAVDGTDPTRLSELVLALGVLAHPAAVPALGRALSRCIAERESRGGERCREWAEYQLLVSLGGLGGVALDLLREVWDRIEHSAVVRALVARGGAAEIEFVLDALDSEPELMADVVKCLGFYDPDAFLPHYTTWARPFLPHLDDERLLQRILDHAGTAPTEDVVEAIARFRNPRARTYLRGVAADDTLPIDTRSMFGRTPRGRAIGLLVELGDEEYVRRAVADEVERVMALDHPHPMHFRELPRWALRERARDLVAADPRPRWVRLLRWFAQPEDRAIFEDLEKSSNDEIAEEAHEFLTWPGFLLDGR